MIAIKLLCCLFAVQILSVSANYGQEDTYTSFDCSLDRPDKYGPYGELYGCIQDASLPGVCFSVRINRCCYCDYVDNVHVCRACDSSNECTSTGQYCKKQDKSLTIFLSILCPAVVIIIVIFVWCTKRGHCFNGATYAVPVYVVNK